MSRREAWTALGPDGRLASEFHRSSHICGESSLLKRTRNVRNKS